MPDQEVLDALRVRIARLSQSQVEALVNIVTQFERSFSFERSSQFFSERFLREFGDALRIHHCFSAQAFTKDKFEYAMARVFRLCGMAASLAPRGNRGHDITVGEERFSLKTQADAKIRRDTIHISKFMELGKDPWSDREEDLFGLRGSFLKHMENYDRIFTLRYFSDSTDHDYELVEIPKNLLSEERGGGFEMKSKSRQMPKPGTFTVSDSKGIRFQLYFDAGSERKLQIKHIRMDLCIRHARWMFAKDVAITEETTSAL